LVATDPVGVLAAIRCVATGIQGAVAGSRVKPVHCIRDCRSGSREMFAASDVDALPFTLMSHMNRGFRTLRRRYRLATLGSSGRCDLKFSRTFELIKIRRVS